jgi:hypothetical protein
LGYFFAGKGYTQVRRRIQMYMAMGSMTIVTSVM